MYNFPHPCSVSCPPGTRQTVAMEALSSDLSLQYPKCEVCPLGEVQPTSGQPQCLPCPTGEYQPGLGGVQCSQCPVDQYQDTTGQFACKACPSGMGVAYTGATSVDNCTCIQNCVSGCECSLWHVSPCVVGVLR